MKIIKTLTFAALAVTLLFQTPLTLAGDNGKKGDGYKGGNRDHRDARVTFTKWVTSWPDQPGLIAEMAGVVGGDVGNGTFTGEVLHYVPPTVSDPVERIVAFYRFHGPKHSFTALLRVEQTGLKAVIFGVVTEGWLKGHSVKGEYTRIECDHVGIEPFCYEGTLKIDRDSKD